MGIVVVNQHQVARLLPMAACIDLMEKTLRTLDADDGVQPLRSIMWQPDRTGALGTMPGSLGDPPVLGLKVITVFPGNVDSPYDSHQGAVLVFDTTHGQLRAIVDASEVTRIRTAAVSGAATRSLARSDARTLAILGTGTQAASHLEAMCAVRPIEHVRVWSRRPESATRFVESHGARLAPSVQPAPTARAAVEDADIVCTVTGASDPVLLGEWLAPGTHINAVGACLPTTRELDGEAMRRSRLFVDRVESVLNEAGDFLLARDEGVIDDTHILGTLGEVFSRTCPGRTSANDITLFKSLGIAVEDLAAAAFILEQAESSPDTMTFELGGFRHEAP